MAALLDLPTSGIIARRLDPVFPGVLTENEKQEESLMVFLSFDLPSCRTFSDLPHHVHPLGCNLLTTTS